MNEIVYLIDSNKDVHGHNLVYLSELNKLDLTEILSLDLKNVPNDSNIIRFLINRFTNFKKQFNSLPTEGIAHFLHADLYYAVPFIKKLSKSERPVIFTMHYFPKGKLKQLLLKNFCNKANQIIVHSEYLKKQYDKLGIKNVTYIDYPSFYDYSKIPSKKEIRNKLGISEDIIVLSALGGTRFEKGLDLLLKALSCLPQKLKNKFLLNVAGRPLDFTEEFIKNEAEKAGIHFRLTVRGMDENEFMSNVLITDYMAIPYRKNFNGNSGPMTEAIVNKIPSIVADHGNLGNITKENNIGKVFKSEDIKDLAAVLENEISNPSTFDFSYGERLTVVNFLKQYEIVYAGLLDSIEKNN